MIFTWWDNRVLLASWVRGLVSWVMSHIKCPDVLLLHILTFFCKSSLINSLVFSWVGVLNCGLDDRRHFITTTNYYYNYCSLNRQKQNDQWWKKFVVALVHFPKQLRVQTCLPVEILYQRIYVAYLDSNSEVSFFLPVSEGRCPIIEILKAGTDCRFCIMLHGKVVKLVANLRYDILFSVNLNSAFIQLKEHLTFLYWQLVMQIQQLWLYLFRLWDSCLWEATQRRWIVLVQIEVWMLNHRGWQLWTNWHL